MGKPRWFLPISSPEDWFTHKRSLRRGAARDVTSSSIQHADLISPCSGFEPKTVCLEVLLGNVWNSLNVIILDENLYIKLLDTTFLSANTPSNIYSLSVFVFFKVKSKYIKRRWLYIFFTFSKSTRVSFYARGPWQVMDFIRKLMNKCIKMRRRRYLWSLSSCKKKKKGKIPFANIP